MIIYKAITGVIILMNRDDKYDPPTFFSTQWKHWKTALEGHPCNACKEMHGKIYSYDDLPSPAPPLHPNCRCVIEPMLAVLVGLATKDGNSGADWWIRHFGSLPANYITETALRKLGWDRGDSPAKFAPGRMVTREIYWNRNGHLPQKPGRIWYEADINYYSGKRNGHRIVWSNDGLMFVTYDHYRTFIEVN